MGVKGGTLRPYVQAGGDRIGVCVDGRYGGGWKVGILTQRKR